MQWRLASRGRLAVGFTIAAFVIAPKTVWAGEGEGPQSQQTVAAAEKPTPTAMQLAAAREFFQRGKLLFEQGKYDAAWFEFMSAYDMAPLPDLLFNMARAEERLNRPTDAAKHYREFLLKSPDDPDAVKIRANIARLEQTGSSASAPSGDGQQPRRRFPLYSAIAGGGTLLFAIIGTAALGTAHSQYNALATRCAPSCAMTEALSLKPTYQTGQAFLTLAAIGAAGTAGLLVWELRRGRRDSSVAMFSGSSAFTTYGSY